MNSCLTTDVFFSLAMHLYSKTLLQNNYTYKSYFVSNVCIHSWPVNSQTGRLVYDKVWWRLRVLLLVKKQTITINYNYTYNSFIVSLMFVFLTTDLLYIICDAQYSDCLLKFDKINFTSKIAKFSPESLKICPFSRIFRLWMPKVMQINEIILYLVLLTLGLSSW